MALLYTKGECQGIHGFVVQLRDLKTHHPLPGQIQILEDIKSSHSIDAAIETKMMAMSVKCIGY